MEMLARELNSILEGTVAGRCLSEYGKNIFFPKGIVAQSEEASLKADKYNATIGMALRDRDPVILPSLAKLLPDFSPKEAVSYPPTSGLPELRDLWLSHIRAKNPSLKGALVSRPAVVPGITAGISLTADLFCEAGDPVIIPDLHWGNYRLIFGTRRGGEIVTYPLFQEKNGDSVFNHRGFADALEQSGKKVIVILNFPNNPTGFSPRLEEKDAILDTILHLGEKGTDIVLLCDDAYFGLFYEEGIITESLFSEGAKLHPNVLAVKADGATKEDYAWGFRTGFLTFGSAGLPAHSVHALEMKLKGAVRSSTSSSPGVSQQLLLKTITSPSYSQEKKAEFEILKRKYTRVRRIVYNIADTIPLQPLPFNSGYFITFRCKKGLNAEVLRKTLLEQGIGILSLGSDHIRVSYASIREDGIEDFFRQVFDAANRCQPVTE